MTTSLKIRILPGALTLGKRLIVEPFETTTRFCSRSSTSGSAQVGRTRVLRQAVIQAPWRASPSSSQYS